MYSSLYEFITKKRSEGEMYADKSKVLDDFVRKVSKMNEELHTEIQKRKSQGVKITPNVKESLWKNLGHDVKLKKLKKEANEAMKEIKKNYAS